MGWDTSKPDGQPRRTLDTSRAREYFGFEARTTFEEGLRRMIEWYMGKKPGTNSPVNLRGCAQVSGWSVWQSRESDPHKL
jgi:dTDP-D-glucose 4,6-dehydratase